MEEKIILTDVDGVLLNWEYAFHVWMESHAFERDIKQASMYRLGPAYGIDDATVLEFIKLFNESAAIGFLPAMRDAKQYVTLLAEQGYRFIAVTSLGKDPFAKKIRKKNLDKIFGKGTFKQVYFLDLDECKSKRLTKLSKKYPGAFWIEDKLENYLVGKSLGLKALLMKHGYNDEADVPESDRVGNWEEIYKLINEGEYAS